MLGADVGHRSGGVEVIGEDLLRLCDGLGAVFYGDFIEVGVSGESSDVARKGREEPSGKMVHSGKKGLGFWERDLGIFMEVSECWVLQIGRAHV